MFTFDTILVAGSIPEGGNYFSIYLILGSTQPLTEISTRNLPAGKKRPAPKAGNLVPNI
jgi:hypothetical protein